MSTLAIYYRNSRRDGDAAWLSSRWGLGSESNGEIECENVALSAEIDSAGEGRALLRPTGFGCDISGENALRTAAAFIGHTVRRAVVPASSYCTLQVTVMCISSSVHFKQRGDSRRFAKAVSLCDGRAIKQGLIRLSPLKHAAKTGQNKDESFSFICFLNHHRAPPAAPPLENEHCGHTETCAADHR